jgi:uncharacterized repeat protein (TIGR01451 family)
MGNDMTNTKRATTWRRRMMQAALAASLVLIGMVAFGTVASAHDNVIVGVASCASPLGSGYDVTWTISNEWDQTEVGTVTAVTGGLSTLHETTFTIGAQNDAYVVHGSSRSATLPYLSTTLTQKLPAGESGVVTLSTNGKWADGFNASDSGTADLSTLHCGGTTTNQGVGIPPVVPPAVTLPATVLPSMSIQSIAGHIYLCNNSSRTTSEVSGGTLAASGPQTLGSSPNPLKTIPVGAGDYTMTATTPADFVLVTCGGTSTPSSSGNSANEAVAVPAGGIGVGTFYVSKIAPALTVVKSAAESNFSAVGQTINYNYLVTNSGNVTISSVGIVDPHAGLNGLSCPEAALAPTASEVCTATYQVTHADLLTGSISNTAKAQGIPPGTTTPIYSNQSSVTVPFASISILKQVCGSGVAADCGPGGNGPWMHSVDIPQGNTAYWKVTVTNTGDVALTDVTVGDVLVPACDATGDTLAVGASMSTYCSLPGISATVTNVAIASFAGLVPPFPSSNAQVMDSPASTSAVSAGPIATPVITSGAIDSLVSLSAAPLVTG